MGAAGMKTFVLILHFAWGGQSVSSVAIPGFATHAACDEFAERAKTQHNVDRAQYTIWAVAHPAVLAWMCVTE